MSGYRRDLIGLCSGFVAIGSLTCWGPTATAQTQCNGASAETLCKCDERPDFDDFGADCSLAELAEDFAGNFVAIGNTKFSRFLPGTFGGVGEISDDLSLVRVTPLDDDPARPGLRFEPSGGAWDFDISATGPDALLGDGGTFQFVIEPLDPAMPLGITASSHDVDASVSTAPFDSSPGPCEFTAWMDEFEGGTTSGSISCFSDIVLFSADTLLGGSGWGLPLDSVSGAPLQGSHTFASQESVGIFLRFESSECDDSETAFSGSATIVAIEVRASVAGSPTGGGGSGGMGGSQAGGSGGMGGSPGNGSGGGGGGCSAAGTTRSPMLEATAMLLLLWRRKERH